jgi:hypothetical protein
MKLLTTITLLFYMTFIGHRAYADTASSMPVELQSGSTAPFTGYLLSLELGNKLMADSQLALKVPLLEQLNTTNNAIIAQNNIEITTLKDDKKQLLDTNAKIQADEQAAHKYDHWIYAGFFAAGVLVAIGLVLVTGYAIEKVDTKAAHVSVAPMLKF